jgi:DNA-binding GntR family transcriptional regulator
MAIHETVVSAADGVQSAPVAALSRRDAVLEQIRRSIVVGALKPGEKLTENALAESYGVSRQTIREAMNLLAQTGWVIQEPYKGMRIASMDEQDVLDLAHIRSSLDLLAVRSIVGDSTGRRLAMVTESWKQLEELAFHADPLIRHDAHVAFHRATWEAAENQLLIKMWPAMEAQITIWIAQYNAAHPEPEHVHSIHKKLYEAIASGDLRRAQRATLEHTVTSKAQLKELAEEYSLD